MTVLVRDRELVSPRPKRFYTTEQLGDRQSLTPDGFLLCEAVPIARIGPQIYGEHELPGLKGKDGLIRVMRDEDEVFRPEAILSFAGKPVTNDHPPEKVTPDNWRNYSVGITLNPRRGDGIQYDNSFLYADLLITDRKAIADIRSGKREVSAGYDAEYEQTNDGEGRQYKIVGNHVALVNRGRCGPLCTIGDEEMPSRVTVHDNRRRSFKDRILDAFRNNDEGALVEELSKVEELRGEQVSGNREEGGSEIRDNNIAIHLHGSGGPSGGGGVSLGGGGATGDQPEADPDNGGGSPAGGDVMQQIMQRLDRIEQAIVILAQGDDDGDEGDMGEDPNNGDGYMQPSHDRRGRMNDRRTRDQNEPSSPDTDEPNEDPSQNLPYGSGSEAEGRDGPQLGAQDRRGTRDRRTADRGMTTDAHRAFVGDSTSMRNEFNDTVARAEMLVSGIRVPTFDAKTPARTTFDSLCALRRNVLTQAYHEGDKRQYIDVMLGGKQADFRQMTCDSVQMVFNGASEMARQATNATIGRARPAAARGGGRALTPAEINARNKELYKIN
jgi:uncharacterized protein